MIPFLTVKPLIWLSKLPYKSNFHVQPQSYHINPCHYMTDEMCLCLLFDLCMWAGPIWLKMFQIRPSQVKREAEPLPWQDMNHRGWSLFVTSITTAEGRDEHAFLSMWEQHVNHWKSPACVQSAETISYTLHAPSAASLPSSWSFSRFDCDVPDCINRD